MSATIHSGSLATSQDEARQSRCGGCPSGDGDSSRAIYGAGPSKGSVPGFEDGKERRASKTTSTKLAGVAMENDTPLGWIVAGVAAVYATLTTAIATLFKMNESRSAKSIEKLESDVKSMQVRLDESDKKHEDCLEDRNNLNVKLARVEEQLNHFVKKIE